MKKGINDFGGVIPAVLSIFDKDENFDEKGTREFIRHLLSYDIGGLYLTGSTGEAFLQNSAERNRHRDGGFSHGRRWPRAFVCLGRRRFLGHQRCAGAILRGSYIGRCCDQLDRFGQADV